MQGLKTALKVSVLLLAWTFVGTSAIAMECTVETTVYPDEYFPQVRISTSEGDFLVELDRRRAPITVNNFLRYVDSGAYRGTMFHRVIDGFVVQGGGYAPDGKEIDTLGDILNESGNGLANNQRTIAMARHDDPHTATSQFYFNLADNESLNPNRKNWGYTVFGRVTEGWEVVEKIGAVETDFSEVMGSTDVPVAPVTVTDVTLVKQDF